MLSVHVMSRQDVERAASYYEDGEDDYYAKDSDAHQWHGEGAAALGLSGPVDSETFRALLAGEVNGRQVRMSVRRDSKQRIGLDMTFSAPKSVSMQALIHGDKAIIEAHDRAVAAAIKRAETLAQARSKINGKTRVENTGNLIVAAFRHETNREQDPQLHTHAVVMNLTQRRDGQWRALRNDEIVKSTKVLGALYRAELARELTRAGYELRHDRDGLFELAHISRAQVAAFSTRAAQVEAQLAGQGLTRDTATADQKQVATLATRASKRNIDRDELHARWVEHAQSLGIQFDVRRHGLTPLARVIVEAPAREGAERALRYAIAHLTERQSIVGERELFDVAVRHGMGAVRLDDVEQAADRLVQSGFLIREQPRYRPAGEPHAEARPVAWWADYLANRAMGRAAERDYFEQSRDVMAEPTTSQFVRDAIMELEKGTAIAALRDLETVDDLMRQRDADYYERSRDLMAEPETSSFVRQSILALEQEPPTSALAKINMLGNLAFLRALEEGYLPEARDAQQRENAPDYFEASCDLMVDPATPAFVRQAIDELERSAPPDALRDLDALASLTELRMATRSRDLMAEPATSQFVRDAIFALEQRPADEARREINTLGHLMLRRAVEDGFLPEVRDDEQRSALRRAKAQVQHAITVGGLVAVEGRYTTQTAIDREVATLRLESKGRGAVAPIMSGEQARAHLAGVRLNDGQRAAAEMIVTTGNRVVGVQGFAGTGKSHMLDEAKRMMEGAGFRFVALAPYGSQVKALRELGVESKTLASFLAAKDKGLDSRTVVVLDEAGVVPARQMARTLEVIEQAGARVVLVGDKAQTKAIEAGRPFDQLQRAGMTVAGMTQIQRQQDQHLRRAVELAAEGRPSASLAHIASITEIADDSRRRSAVAEHYVALPDRDRTLIVSGTNEARREINHQVRVGLGLAGKGAEYDTLIRRDTTQAERRHAKNYRLGDIIQPERDYARIGLKRGALYRVIDTGPGNRLTVRDAHGSEHRFSPMQAGKLSVYQPERAELSRGDRVRITRNDAALDLANGDRFTVAALARDKVTLTDGKRTVELPAGRPLHLDHAYATTVHSSQGLTSDRVLIDAQTTSRTTARDVYYVAISRARHEARIYTNDREHLPVAIERENEKYAALSISHPVAERHERALGLA